jgi:hypothetical protein
VVVPDVEVHGSHIQYCPAAGPVGERNRHTAAVELCNHLTIQAVEGRKVDQPREPNPHSNPQVFSTAPTVINVQFFVVNG